MNKILFGGAFDPIHQGHINMAEKASIQLDADVIFLPARSSIWKKETTDVNHKIEMLKLAINGYKRFSISLFEVNSDKENNYSVDTARYFVKEYPNDKFYFLIGTDHVNSFHKWKEAEELSKIVQIIFFDRPNYEINQENVKKYHMIQIVGSPKDISSTEIRDLNSLDLSKNVLDYIVNHNLYFVAKIRSFLGEKRFKHSVSVASLAYEIAKKHNLDNPEQAYIAGLLHDVGKEIDQKPIMEEYYQEFLDLPRFSYHQFAGEYIAKKEFGIVDKGILEAIKYHATGNKEMGTLAKIIYAADKIEPTRGFDSSDLINAMMEDIDKGFVTVLKANKEFLETHRGDINNRLTSSCFDYYL